MLKASRKASEENRQKLTMTREVKKKSKECKDKWIEGKCEIVEDSANNQNSQKLYRTTNEICGVYSTKIIRVNDKAGQTLAEKDQFKKKMGRIL